MWWTKILRAGKPEPEIERHKTKLDAAIALNFARNLGNVPLSNLALYKQDPRKHPETKDLFPAELLKAQMRQLKKASRSRAR